MLVAYLCWPLFPLLQVSFSRLPRPDPTNPRHRRAMVQWSPLMIYTAIKISLYKIFCGWLKPKPLLHLSGIRAVCTE